jgi:hypothetical protein
MPYCLFFTVIFFIGYTVQVISADINDIGVKEFMANPPPIRDFSATIRNLNNPNVTNLYCYVRWQKGDFVSLLSRNNKLVLEGITDHSDGFPIGRGNFGDYFWYIQGEERQVNVFEWNEAKNAKPSELRIRSINPGLKHPTYTLLTFGCLGESPYSIHWKGNKAHISQPEIPGEQDLELEFDKDGKAKRLHYTFQNTDPKL